MRPVRIAPLIFATAVLAGCSSSHARNAVHPSTTAALSSTTSGFGGPYGEVNGGSAGPSIGSPQGQQAEPGSGTLNCDPAPASLVNGALGTDLTGPVARLNGSAVSCSYASGSFRSAVVLDFTGATDSKSFGSMAARLAEYGATTTSIAGIGDEAIAASVGSGPDQTDTVAVRKGNVSVTVTAPAPLDKVEFLAREVISRIHK